MELILTIDDLSLRLAQFDQQIRTEGTRTDSSFANATICQHDVKEAEGFVTPARACWTLVGALAKRHEKNQLRRISVPA